MRTTWRPGLPLNPSDQEKLRAFILKHGEAGAAERLEVSRVSMVRAAAGVGVRQVTARAISLSLAAEAIAVCAAVVL